VLMLTVRPSIAHAAGRDLESVLRQIDLAASKFKSAQAEISWDHYTKVVDEHDLQAGTIHYVRKAESIQVAAILSCRRANRLY
jgi:hypothetical protein